ncbi:Uncharacterized protein FWK35_00035244 [Aphis craccivora]|uniref:Uncharacterized protein n=1 Tax=Aphis craccivora TaxID=307492 RepID=A0A6G0VIH3_APHCR|nr:Uncharacterized protein FWK35_00035244 [Aphis craccivora]
MVEEKLLSLRYFVLANFRKFNIFRLLTILRKISRFSVISDSERSDECIDFTMLCFFFVSVYMRTCRNNALISNFGVVSCSKMNLVDALRRSFFEFQNSFQKRREKPKKKIKEKRKFLSKTSFRPNRLFYMVCR